MTRTIVSAIALLLFALFGPLLVWNGVIALTKWWVAEGMPIEIASTIATLNLMVGMIGPPVAIVVLWLRSRLKRIA